MQKRSSQFKTQLLHQRKEGSYSIWISYFHYFIFIIFTFPHAANHFKNFPSSQLVCQLNRLERCAPDKFFFSPASVPTLFPTMYLQAVYRERSISTILRKNRGLRRVYRAYGFILPLMSLFHPVSPTPPHTAVKRLSMREELRGDRHIRFGKSMHMWLYVFLRARTEKFSLYFKKVHWRWIGRIRRTYNRKCKYE